MRCSRKSIRDDCGTVSIFQMCDCLFGEWHVIRVSQLPRIILRSITFGHYWVDRSLSKAQNVRARDDGSALFPNSHFFSSRQIFSTNSCGCSSNGIYQLHIWIMHGSLNLYTSTWDTSIFVSLNVASSHVHTFNNHSVLFSQNSFDNSWSIG